jgi:hypothetical protein
MPHERDPVTATTFVSGKRIRFGSLKVTLASKGISGSSEGPRATVEPSGTKRRMASAIPISFPLTSNEVSA